MRQVKEEKESLEQRLEKSEGDMKLLEFASTRGWVSALSSDDVSWKISRFNRTNIEKGAL